MTDHRDYGDEDRPQGATPATYRNDLDALRELHEAMSVALSFRRLSANQAQREEAMRAIEVWRRVDLYLSNPRPSDVQAPFKLDHAAPIALKTGAIICKTCGQTYGMSELHDCPGLWRKPDYEPAWRELHEALAWMQGNRALTGRYLGRNFAAIANDLIDRAYPGLREGKLAAIPPTEARPTGETDKYQLMLLDLLAVIHRDGGHKTQEIGVKLAWEQAMQLSSERIAATDQPRLTSEGSDGLPVGGPFKLPVRHEENYSGEHRDWIVHYTLPDWLVRDIQQATLSRGAA